MMCGKSVFLYGTAAGNRTANSPNLAIHFMPHARFPETLMMSTLAGEALLKGVLETDILWRSFTPIVR
jgi:hypothetical protein